MNMLSANCNGKTNFGDLTILIPISSLSPTIAVTPAVPTTPASPDSVSELIQHLSQLTLLIQNQMAGTTLTASTPIVKSISVASLRSSRFNAGERIASCVCCDSIQHVKCDCQKLPEDLQLRIIKLNDKGHIVNGTTGEDIPLMYGRGGMKWIVELSHPRASPSSPALVMVNTSTIMIHDSCFYGNLYEGSIRVTTLDYENGVRIDEIIDAEVEMKRKKDNIERTRGVRPRLDSPPS